MAVASLRKYSSHKPAIPRFRPDITSRGTCELTCELVPDTYSLVVLSTDARRGAADLEGSAVQEPDNQ